jgi:NADPH-dependent glutamate synthase beta subunit-like oxidoreductase/2,4-dienoyl-CoA reductase-like NADH-dependent reductase (Old Yellow Enzyme family)
MVVEAAVVLPSRSSFNLRVSDDRFIDELKEFVKEIRKINPDLKIGLQLIHFLKVARSGWRQRVEDLKPEEIAVIPGQFAEGAARARTAGFDFVELHMAHFTTLASFLSLVNKRTDEYGGDFEGRIKLPTDVVLTARRTVGDDYLIGARILGEEFTKEGNTLLQSARAGRRLASLGLDYISVSAGERFEDAEPPLPNFPPFAGTGYSGYRMSPRWWNPDGVQVYLAEGIRRAVREGGYTTPVVAAGKIRMPDLAEEIVALGKADFVGMARTLLADPDWPAKAKAGEPDEIVKCAACGYCSESDERYETVTCIEWPTGDLNAPHPWYLVPPCKAACPAGLDIRSYIDLAAHGHYEKALETIEEKIPFPGTIGRVCPHPCETKCNRSQLDQSIAINGLKRFIADAVYARGTRVITPAARIYDTRVAVIGAGPAGLTAAFNLVQMGYGVTVFEALPIAGGMLTVGIPEYRLPRDVVRREIEYIQKAGVELRLNSPVGTGGLTLDSLSQAGYQAIFVAIGAHKSVPLHVPGEELEGTLSGTAFLKDVNLGHCVKIGKKVAVIGGGNVAVDAARAARRLGADVTIIYRRSREEMPAYRDEVEAAEKEGIKIEFLAMPRKITDTNGRVAGVECLRTVLGAPDESGRRRPEALAGSAFTITVDTMISAIGEIPDLAFLGNAFEKEAGTSLRAHPYSCATDRTGVFAGGDVVTGPRTVIEAIAAGRKAAVAIDRFLRGQKLDDEELAPRIIGIEDVDVTRFKKHERQAMPEAPIADRVKSFGEVALGFSERPALFEADRCLQCGLFPNKTRDR